MAGRLVDKLQEQLKPTLSVFIVGGINGLFNLLYAIIYTVETFYDVTPLTHIYYNRLCMDPNTITEPCSVLWYLQR